MTDVKHHYHGSIPSRYEAVLITSHRSAEKKGFGSHDTRFKTTHYKDCPGPGAYEKSIIKPLIDPTPSHSKKGYGNSFVSKTPKDFELASAKTPGPGAYNLKGIDHIEDNRPTSAFIESGDGRVPYPDPKKCKKNIPGPLDYSPNIDMTPTLLKTLSSGTFRSKSKRDSFLAKDNGVPNAGKYNLSGTETVPIPAFFWSRSTYKRFQNMGMDNKVPGPGAYFDKKINEKREEEFLKSNARVVGALRGVKYLGKQNDKPVSAIHTFGADKDRFKHSFMGRLDLKAEIPGPGSYNDSVGSLSRRPKTSVQAFGSSGQRIADVCKHGVPGPAYYKASTPNYRPPTQNLDSHWI